MPIISPHFHSRFISLHSLSCPVISSHSVSLLWVHLPSYSFMSLQSLNFPSVHCHCSVNFLWFPTIFLSPSLSLPIPRISLQFPPCLFMSFTLVLLQSRLHFLHFPSSPVSLHFPSPAFTSHPVQTLSFSKKVARRRPRKRFPARASNMNNTDLNVCPTFDAVLQMFATGPSITCFVGSLPGYSLLRNSLFHTTNCTGRGFCGKVEK